MYYREHSVKMAIAAIFSLIIFIPASATIINVPDDYETIQEGIDASSDGDTVLVQPGMYVENINFNGHNIVLGSLFLTTGDTGYIEQTVIDGDQSGSVVTFESGEDSTAVITGFTVLNGYANYGGGIYCNESNPMIIFNTITMNIARSGYYSGYGGGIYCHETNAIIINNVITENHAAFGGGGISCYYNGNAIILNNIINNNYASCLGGGIECWGSNLIINNNKIVNNLAHEEGGGIWCYDTQSIISCNLITNNTALESNGGRGYGGGIFCNASIPIVNNTIIANHAQKYGGGIWCNYNPNIINNIFWNNDALEGDQIYVGGHIPTITYCNIQDTLWPGEGNIDVDPLFRDPENGDFHLMATYCGDPYDSPCIDAGHPDILDSLLDCDWGLGELRSDMGAYGGGDSVQVSIANHQVQIPDRIALLQNYPNPFNATTKISFSLSEPQFVILKIYDLLGREVQTLVDEQRQAGVHDVMFDASGLSSGIYFYRIQTDDYSESKRMVLLK